MLSEAGLVEQYTNEDGKEAYRLTPTGAQLGRAMAMAMAGEDDRAVPDALLGRRSATRHNTFTERHHHDGGDCMCFESEQGPSYHEALAAYVGGRR